MKETTHKLTPEQAVNMFITLTKTMLRQETKDQLAEIFVLFWESGFKAGQESRRPE
jgi:hypothetical protein